MILSLFTYYSIGWRIGNYRYYFKMATYIRREQGTRLLTNMKYDWGMDKL